MNENIATSSKFEMKNVLMTSLSIIASLFFIYLIVFFVSRAWKKGQTNP